MSPIQRSPKSSYNFAARNQLQRDEFDYRGTTRNMLRLDTDQVAGLTRAVVTVDRPRTWKRNTEN